MPTVSRWAALSAAGLLVGGSVLVGRWLTHRGTDLHLATAYPLHGRYRVHAGGWLVPAVALAAAAIRFGPALAARLAWPRLLVAAYLAAGVWAVALAAVAGPAAIAAPLGSPSEYLAEVDRVNTMGVRAFLATFSDHIVSGPDRFGWTTHVAGHPPLATLVFVQLARVGLAGPGWAAALCIAVGASAVVSVLATVRLLGGEPAARRAAPFVVFAPVALWVATSADALFAGVAAAGVWTLAAAARHPGEPAAGDRLCSASAGGTPDVRYPVTSAPFPPGKQSKGGLAVTAGLTARSGLLAGAGGVALGACLMLSYGLVLLAPIAVAVVLAGGGRWRRSVTILAVALAAVLAVLAVFAALGFWWPEGLARAADRVVLGDGWRNRPAAYFLLANPAALAIAVGPAVVAAAATANRRVAVPAAPAIGALVAVALSIASNLSKGEVERIYLPFAVWLLPLAALHVVGGSSGRGWLAAQVAWAVLIAATTSLTW
jgi:hypothetical protein